MTITDTGTRIDLPLVEYSKRRGVTIKEGYIDFTGVNGANAWLFHTPKEALVVYTQLQDYMMGK